MKPIPTHLDDPSQMLLWEADEFVLLAVMFGVGILVGHLTPMILASLLLVRGYRRLRDRRPNGFLVHMAYWYTGVGSNASHSLPLAFVRRFF